MPTDQARGLRSRITFATLSVAAHAALVLGIGGSSAQDASTVEPMVDLVGEITLTSVLLAGAPQPTEEPAPAPRARARRESDPAPIAPAAPEVLAIATTAPAELAPTTSTPIEAPTSAPSGDTTRGTAAQTIGSGSGVLTASAGGGGGTVLVVDDRDAVRAFVAHVRARVLAARRYPRAAESRGLEGDVYVTIEIARDGSVRVLGVDAQGVAETLVNAATTAIAEAGPFPIPDSVTRASVRARLPIRFHIGE